MGKIKDWKMAMEELAEEAIMDAMGEAEAIEYMANNLESKYPVGQELKKIYQETLKKADDLGVEIPSPRGYIDLFELTGRMSGDKDKKDK